MEHVLVTRELELEKIFFQSRHLEGRKLVLRSCNSIHHFLEIKTCATAIIDESVIYLTKEHSETTLRVLYQTILKNNAKCLVLFLYQEESPLIQKLRKKNPYTLFLKKSSLTLNKLNFIFEINKHQVFRALFTKDLVSSAAVPINLYLYNPLEESFLKFIEKDQKLKKEILERLENGNVSQLFVRSEDFSDYLKVNKSHHHLYLSQEMHHLRKQYKYFLSEITDDADKGEWGKGRQLFSDISLLYDKIKNLISKFDGPENALRRLTFLRKTPVALGLNCAIYAVIFSRILGVKDEKEICLAALIFSCGKAHTHSQDEIRNALGEIDLEARATYLRYLDHTLETIKKRKLPVEPRTLDCIRHHKENYDGSGYPQGLLNDEIPLGAQLLGIIESFNNLYTFRQNERFRNFKSAWNKLRENSRESTMGAKHSPKLLDEIEDRLTKRGIL